MSGFVAARNAESTFSFTTKEVAVRRFRLTNTAKAFSALVVAGVVSLTFYCNPGLLRKVAPSASSTQHSNVPTVGALPGEAASGSFPSVDRRRSRLRRQARGALLPLGVERADGDDARDRRQAGRRTDSLMCKHGVNLVLVREDNTDQMQNQLVTFAEGVKKGESNPKDGAHFVAIMGDGSAQFLKGVDDRLGKLGPDYMAVVVGSAGYSRGEDKFMGPQAWRDNPQRAKGGVVAGVLRDGDWNIALKWMGDNKIANNPDEKTYDPDAVNWVNASDYIDAAQKYVSGYCADLKNVKTGKTEKHCVDARRHVDARRRHRRRAEGRARLDRLDPRVPLADAERHHRKQEVDVHAPRDHQGHALGDLRGGRPRQDR